MSPKGHHAEMKESEVLDHIAGKLGCDLERASRAFNSMRNPKSRVLVFDAMHRQWKGCDWTPTDQPSSQQMLRDNLRHLERKHSEIAKQKRSIEANMDKLLARVEKLEKRLARLQYPEQMANQSEANDSGDEHQGRLPQKQKQPTREEQQAALMAKVMSPDWNNQPPVVPYVRPKTFSSGSKATDSGPKRVWREDSGDGREDSGDGYAETIKKHWQEA